MQFAEIRNDYVWGPAVEGGRSYPSNKALLAAVSIDGWETGNDDEQGAVLANVILTIHGDIIVDFHDNGVRMNKQVLEAIEEAKKKLQEIWEGHKSKTTVYISADQIESAKSILADNGIESDETETVLQAIGYALLDMELFPEEEEIA